MTINYDDIFKRAGIAGMGRQGSGWCGVDAAGILVLMAHQVYFHKDENGWYYETPREGIQPKRAPSAERSLKMIEAYFAPAKPIILLVGEFLSDGGPNNDGVWKSSVFKEATGFAYNAVMKEFDRATGHILCIDCQKFELQ